MVSVVTLVAALHMIHPAANATAEREVTRSLQQWLLESQPPLPPEVRCSLLGAAVGLAGPGGLAGREVAPLLVLLVLGCLGEEERQVRARRRSGAEIERIWKHCCVVLVHEASSQICAKIRQNPLNMFRRPIQYALYVTTVEDLLGACKGRPTLMITSCPFMRIWIKIVLFGNWPHLTR